MPNSPLNAKLHAHATLLPSQRELLERVIFQLEFNGFQHIHLVGKAGSGKTTLCLVLAELLSDEMVLAYFSAEPSMTTQSCQQQLLQQWFGLSDYETSLMQQLEQTQAQPLAWVLDSQGDLPHSCLSMLRAHPVHIITTGPDVLTEADVNLTIPAITEADARQLLSESAISAWSIDDRLEHAAGNLHRLLEPDATVVEPEASSGAKASGLSAMRYRLASISLALVGALVITAYWWLNSSQEQAELAELPADNQLAQRFQAPALHEQSALPRGAEQSDEAISTTSEEPIPSEARQRAAIDEPERDEPSEPTPADDSEPSPAEPEVEDTTLAAEASPTTDLASESQSDELTHEPAVASQHATEYRYHEAELLAMGAESFALQLGAFSTEASAKRLVASAPEVSMLLYQRLLGSQLQWVVLHGPFDDAASARNARSRLPEPLQADTPFAKSLRSIQEEIRQRVTDDSGDL
ncbi:MAG: SPOR domain-containing protein [Alkalimonas sp.]|nr:SPOR domain-containing protein [Alkalimonas sp.]